MPLTDEEKQKILEGYHQEKQQDPIKVLVVSGKKMDVLDVLFGL